VVTMTDRFAPDQLRIHSLVGRRYGTLLVRALLPGRKCRVYCEACGKSKIRDKRGLYRVKSCGCLRSKLIGQGHTKHGAKTAAGATTEYTCWSNKKTVATTNAGKIIRSMAEEESVSVRNGARVSFNS